MINFAHSSMFRDVIQYRCPSTPSLVPKTSLDWPHSILILSWSRLARVRLPRPKVVGFCDGIQLSTTAVSRT